MTHLEKFIALYKEVGIELIAEKRAAHEDNNGHSLPAGFVLKIENNMYHPTSDKIDGYGGFYTDICFDEHGNFLKQGFWE